MKTESKLFCGCQNKYGSPPNTHICPVCTGQPGVLPVMNEKAMEQAVRVSLALGCAVNRTSVFARKQYFYPDLPKNYQISQYKIPLGENGALYVDGEKISIERAHLEEDAGKLVHSRGGITKIDYNRGGTPLLEIVTRPDIKSPAQAADYLKILRQRLRYAGVSDCDMEKGSLRCDANISLSPGDSDRLGTKTEVKNMNSFKGVFRALEYEAKRQEKVLTEKGEVMQETRLWDEDSSVTKTMRTKEEAHDYRYFPDPDLPPLVIRQEKIDEIKVSMPEFPSQRKKRLTEKFKLSEYDAGVLTGEKEVVDYFEEALETAGYENAKKLSNWVTVELMGRVNSENVQFCDQPVKPEYMGKMVFLIKDGTISGKMAKKVFDIMWDEGKPPEEIIREKGMKQITSQDKISDICGKAIEENPELVEKYLGGKTGVIGALVGSVMRETKGQANPKLVNEKLCQLLEKKK